MDAVSVSLHFFSFPKKPWILSIVKYPEEDVAMRIELKSSNPGEKWIADIHDAEHHCAARSQLSTDELVNAIHDFVGAYRREQTDQFNAELSLAHSKYRGNLVLQFDFKLKVCTAIYYCRYFFEMHKQRHLDKLVPPSTNERVTFSNLQRPSDYFGHTYGDTPVDEEVLRQLQRQFQPSSTPVLDSGRFHGLDPPTNAPYQLQQVPSSTSQDRAQYSEMPSTGGVYDYRYMRRRSGTEESSRRRDDGVHRLRSQEEKVDSFPATPGELSPASHFRNLKLAEKTGPAPASLSVGSSQATQRRTTFRNRPVTRAGVNASPDDNDTILAFIEEEKRNEERALQERAVNQERATKQGRTDKEERAPASILRQNQPQQPPSQQQEQLKHQPRQQEPLSPSSFIRHLRSEKLSRDKRRPSANQATNDSRGNQHTHDSAQGIDIDWP